MDVSNRNQALADLKSRYGGEIEVWKNNNGTLRQRACVIDLTSLKGAPEDIISRLYEYNINRFEGEKPLAAVPVAGWKTAKSPWYYPLIALCHSEAGKQRLTEEYAKSFSLSPPTTALNADIVLRVHKKGQFIEVFRYEGKLRVRVSAGVRITDLEEFLHKRGLAIASMPTLHVASVVGASANGSYGPGRDSGPMTSGIVEMDVVDPKGNPMTLSRAENPRYFEIFKDCHMGAAFFVKSLTFGNIEQQFRMKRRHVFYRDASSMKTKRWLKKEHFISMYIPVDIDKTGNHFPRVRVTTFERTGEKPNSRTKCREHTDVCDYFSLAKTEAGEPLIDLVVRSPELRKFLPLLIKFAAINTYGYEDNVVEIDWSHKISHLFRTYTDLPIKDINWLIQVKSVAQAGKVHSDLFKLTERKLKKLSQKGEYPLFNVICRYLKGVFNPKTIAPAAINDKNNSIFSFELITYAPLFETAAFKSLAGKVIRYLNNHNLPFTYHPGKNAPIQSLSQMDRKDRLKTFQKAVIQIHGGDIGNSPFLTLQKKVYLGLAPLPKQTGKAKIRVGDISKTQKKQALKAIDRLRTEYFGL